MTRTLSFAAFVIFAVTAPAFAMSDRGFEQGRRENNSKPEVVLNVACIQSALDKRENAIITAHNTYSGSITNALTARKDTLKTAWAKPTRQERRVARDAAWKTFKESHRSAHEGLRSTRKTAWNTFDVDMKACGVSKEAHGESADVGPRPIAL